MKVLGEVRRQVFRNDIGNGGTDGHRVGAHVLLLFLIFLLAGQTAVAQSPQARRQYNNAIQLIEAHQDAIAIRPLEQAIKIDPNWYEPRVRLAEVRDGLKMYPEAIKQMEVVVSQLKFPPNLQADFWQRLGKYRFREAMTHPEGQRNLDSAVDALQKSLAANAKAFDSDYYLARIYLAKGDTQKALDFLKAAIDAQPDNPLYRALSAELHYRQGKETNEVALIRQAAVEAQQAAEKLSKDTHQYFDNEELLSAIQSDLNMRFWTRVTWIGVPTAVGLILLVVGISIKRARREGGSPLARRGLGLQDSTYTDIAAVTLRTLCTAARMELGVFYLSSVDGREMKPFATLRFEPEEVKPMRVVDVELPRWLERNDGKPFLFSNEKRESAFTKVFPEGRDMLETLQIRIGVPFLFQERLMGVAFLGVENPVDDPAVLKKRFDRVQEQMYQVAVDVGSALYRIREAELADVDVVTKLKSRRYVEENLGAALAKADEAGTPGMVAVFEWDQFSNLQEKHGDDEADAVLRSVADELRHTVTSKDAIVARLEHGRFLVYCPIESEDAARDMAQRLRHCVASARIPANMGAPTASVGVAMFPDNGTDANDLIWSADTIMMGVSAGGGNSISFADDGVTPRAQTPVAAARPSSSVGQTAVSPKVASNGGSGVHPSVASKPPSGPPLTSSSGAPNVGPAPSFIAAPPATAKASPPASAAGPPLSASPGPPPSASAEARSPGIPSGPSVGPTGPPAGTSAAVPGGASAPPPMTPFIPGRPAPPPGTSPPNLGPPLNAPTPAASLPPPPGASPPLSAAAAPPQGEPLKPAAGAAPADDGAAKVPGFSGTLRSPAGEASAPRRPAGSGLLRGGSSSGPPAGATPPPPPPIAPPPGKAAVPWAAAPDPAAPRDPSPTPQTPPKTDASDAWLASSTPPPEPPKQ